MVRLGGYAGYVRQFDLLVVVSLIWFLGKGTRYLFPPLFETFQGEFGLTPATLGLLYSALMVAYAGMQFPSGAIADRIGRTGVITAGAALLGVAALWLFVSQAYLVLVAVMVLIGIGTGVHKTVAIDLVAAVYPDRTAKMLGTMDAFGTISGVVAPTVIVALLGLSLRWNLAFLGAGMAGLALAVAFYRVATRHDPASATDDTAAEGHVVEGDSSYLAAFEDRRFAVFVAVVVAYSFVWNGLVAFLPLFMTSAKGLTQAAAGFTFAVLFAAGLVQPVTGALGDRIGRYPVLVATLVLQTVALGLLLVIGHPWVLAAVVGLMGVGFHGFRPVRDSNLVSLIPAAVSGGTLGLVRTIMIGLGSVSPAIIGALLESVGFTTAFGLLVGISVLSTVAVVGLALTEPSRSTRAVAGS